MIDVPLVVGIGVYFVSSLGGVSIVKLLNYHYCFTSWWIFALLSRSTWILAALLHGILQVREQVHLRFSFYQLRLYLLIAVGLSLVEIVNSFSMSVLPGSLYMLLKGSDVGWSMTLSFILLRKRYSGLQVVAASLIILGIGVVFFLDVRNDQIMPKAQQETSTLFATSLCLGGALLNSLCSVGAEALLKQTLQNEQDRLFLEEQQSSLPPSKLLLSNSYSMWTSFFSFGLLVIPVLFLSQNEDPKDARNSTIASCPNNLPQDDITAAASSLDYDPSRALLGAMGLCLAFLGISRFLERLGKHFICVHASAVTFSMVQAARRWWGIYIVGLLFREGFAHGMIVGSLVSGIGFLLHGYAAIKSSSRDYKKLASTAPDNHDMDESMQNHETMEMTERTTKDGSW
jgi:UAA transporter family